ncbi:ABC-type nitrate/sulfonate/bicarbonate transport systems, periplasmic components [Rhodovastum atsumiense]|nr:ABC transporter substrate-binding protein [Rhodovastum atsumiense]CAH2601937.1 ABC-type nitrate/sulfonate/bicarbonate transport systems, periplasmic components [Rhodovastum atsumiense]
MTSYPHQIGSLPRVGSAGGHGTVRRRGLLRLGMVAAVTAPFGLRPSPASAAAELGAPAILQGRNKLTIIWTPSSLCNVVIGLAQRQGIYEKHGLDVTTLNVGSDTSAILEALALGKADATSNFLLRFLKPLEAGFDVKLTAGVHGGCSILIGSRDAGIEKLQDLAGKRIGMSDLSSPMKLLYEIHLRKNGVPPDSITWRQFPADVFPLAVQKKEIEAFADGHPTAYYAIKRSNGRLFELASNGTGELGQYTCCVLAVSGKLLRENRPAAVALTRAMVEASKMVDRNNSLAVDAAQHYSPRQVKPEEIGEMIASYPYDEVRGCPTGEAFRKHVLYFAQGLKETGILKPSTDVVKFTNRITLDILSTS